jgi:hypothetical protein
MKKPPKISPVPSSKDKLPPTPHPSVTIEWSFSFKFFNQVEYFGLGDVRSSWFVSLLERLRDISRIDPESLNNSSSSAHGIRYHKIDWAARGIPVTRQDFKWLDKVILENENDFPFYQFHVSKAVGRVIGFWNNTSQVFYILVLDPMHNLQPSKRNNYQVRRTSTIDCQYTSLLRDIESLKSKALKCSECEFSTFVRRLPSPAIGENALIFFLDKSYLEELIAKLDSNSTISQIIELGIIHASEN